MHIFKILPFLGGYTMDLLMKVMDFSCLLLLLIAVITALDTYCFLIHIVEMDLAQSCYIHLSVLLIISSLTQIES